MEIIKDIRKVQLYMYLTAFLQFQGFIGSVLFVFYTRYMNLSVEQYLFVDALLFFIMAFVEIPSGAIADHFGRKKILIISKLFIIFGMMILLTTKSFWGAVVVAIIYGFFGALESGVADSIIYEKYEIYKCVKEYEYVEAKVTSISFIVSMIYSVISGYLIKANLALPIYFDMFVSILSVISVVFLLEDNVNYKKKQEKKFLLNKEEVINIFPIIAVSSVLLGCSRVIYSFFQPVLIEVKFPICWLGYIAALYSIVSAISSGLYKKIRKRLTPNAMLTLIIILQMVSCVGVALSKSMFVIGFIILNQIQRGIMGPFLYVQVNGYICSKNGNRVTLMSVYFCVTTLISSLLLAGVSYVSKMFGMSVMMILFAYVINFIVIVLDFYYLKKKQKGQVKCYIEE